MAEQGLTYRINVDASDAASKLKALSDSLTKADSKINSLGESSKRQLDKASDTIKQLKATIDNLHLTGDSKDRIDSLFNSLTTSLSSAKRQLTKDSKQVKKISGDTLKDIKSEWNKLYGDLQNIASGVQNESKKTAKQIQSDSENTKKSVSGVNEQLNTMLSVLTAIGAVKFTKEIISAASEAERALFGLNKIYGDYADEAQLASESLADMYALSKAEATRQVTAASKILDVYHLENDALLQLSSGFVSLAQDLSAFTGGTVNATTAMSALESAVLGNYRALKLTFNVGISEDSIKRIAERWGLAVDNLSDAQKVLLRYQAIMEATTNVTGTFAESQDSLYVKQQQLQASFADLKEVLGEQLLPTLSWAVDVLKNLVQSFADANDGVRLFLSGTAGLVALSTVALKCVTSVAKLATALKALGIASQAAIIGIGAIVASITVLTLSSIARAIESQKDAIHDIADEVSATKSALDAYITKEEEVKKAVDDTTRALLLQQQAIAAQKVAANVDNLIKEFNSGNSTLSSAKKAVQGHAETESRASSALQEVASRYGRNISNVDDVNWLVENIKEYRDILEAYGYDLSKVEKDNASLATAQEQVVNNVKGLAQAYAYLEANNESGVFSVQMQEIKELLSDNMLPLFYNELDKTRDVLKGVSESSDDAGVSVKELAQDLNYVEQDWDKMLSNSESKLTSSKTALQKVTNEYRKVRDEAIAALDIEYAGYQKAIKDRRDALENEQSKLNLKTDKGVARNTEIEEELALLDADESKAEQWYKNMVDYYKYTYTKNVQTAAEKLADKLEAIEYEKNRTLKQEEDATIADLEKKWGEYAETFDASIGGGTDYSSIKSRESLEAYISAVSGMTDAEGNPIATAEQLSAFRAGWEKYQQSITDVTDDYARQRAEKAADLNAELINVQMSSNRIALVDKQELELDALDAQHTAELLALEKEYKDSENYGDLKKTLLAKQLQERMNLEDSHADELHALEVEADNRIRSARLAAVGITLQEQYDLEKEARDSQRAEEIRNATATGADVQKINEYYDKLDENAEREHQRKLTEIALSAATTRAGLLAGSTTTKNMGIGARFQLRQAGQKALNAANNGDYSQSYFSALGYDTQTANQMQAVILGAQSQLANTTDAETQEAIRAKMYDDLLKLGFDYADALADLNSKIKAEEMDNVKTTYAERQKYEMDALKEERDTVLGAIVDTNSDEYKLTENLYKTRIKNLEDEQAEERIQIARDQNEAVLSAQKELLFDREQLYEAERSAIERERDYELETAEQTGKDRLKIQAEYDAKLQKLYNDHVTEMAATTTDLKRNLLSLETQLYGERGGLFDLLGGLMSRQDRTRTSNAYDITDTIGNVPGINSTLFASARDGLAGSIKRGMDEGWSEEEFKKWMKTRFDLLGYEGDDFELIWENIWAEMRIDAENEMEKLTEAVTRSLDGLQDVFNKLDTLFTMAEDNRMQNLQNMLTDLQNAQDQLEKEASDSGRELTKDEQDELARRQAMYEEQIERQEALIKAENEKQFKREQEFAVAEATISGLKAAITSFTDNGGWPWGLVPAAMSTAFTAAQIALIKSQPMPSYAQGAYELPSDQVAQVHQGEMIVPKPFAEELRENGGMGGAILVNIYGASNDASVEETTTNDNIKQLDIFVSNKVKSMVARGELDTTLQSRYTINRNGRRG